MLKGIPYLCLENSNIRSLFVSNYKYSNILLLNHSNELFSLTMIGIGFVLIEIKCEKEKHKVEKAFSSGNIPSSIQNMCLKSFEIRFYTYF